MSEPGSAPSSTDGRAPTPARDLADAREQVSASREILEALGRATDDPGRVLDAIVERSMRLCGAHAAQLYLREGESFQVSRMAGEVPEEFHRQLRDRPVTVDRSSLVGRVVQDRRTQQIADVLTDPTYGRLDLQALAGFRTLLAAPLIVGEEVVGVLLMWRAEVVPFDEREVALLEEFAAQGAIALRQVDLMRSLEEQRVELARKVAQLEALREVGDAVASTLDRDEVLSRIVTNAVVLTDTDGGSVMEYDAAHDEFRVRAAYGSSPQLVAALRRVRIRADRTLVGRTGLERRPIAVPDLGAVRLDRHLEALYRDGWRSLLAAPILRGELLLGVVVIRRRSVGPFSEEVVELLETLASQSAVAIVNARLFGELARKSQELEVASRHKSEFLASMSHELRTPLNAVIGFSEVLIDRMFGDLNERQDEYLHDIRNSGRHLLELLNEILDLSKVEAGRLELEPTEFLAPSALEYALSLVRERASAHRIALSLQVEDGVGLLEADELRFKQVVLNLVSNAVKFTPDGGTVTVRASASDDGLTVTVSDTGVGIPEEDRERIFESFQQGGRGAPREEGTGLGLTLSRRLVELLGGHLWLDSALGAGSTFGFTIPLRPPLAPGYRKPDPADDDLPVVLLVDDDRASLDLVSAYLSGGRAHVVRARDGVDALTMVRQLSPAAVVLDIRLPRLDGWEVLSRLKADPGTAGIPVVVVSVVDERARGLALGAADYLLKPIRRADLVAALDRVGALRAEGPAGGVP